MPTRASKEPLSFDVHAPRLSQRDIVTRKGKLNSRRKASKWKFWRSELAHLGPLATTAISALPALTGLPGIVKKSQWQYDKYFTFNREVDKSRLPEVLDASTFMLNSYDPSGEIPGWKYEWIEDHGVYAAFFAYRVNEDTGKMDLVFSFRGSSDLTDFATDVNASHAYTIDEWCGYDLPIPITAASGFLNRVVALGKAGLADIVSDILDNHENMLKLQYGTTGPDVDDEDAPGDFSDSEFMDNNVDFRRPWEKQRDSEFYPIGDNQAEAINQISRTHFQQSPFMREGQLTGSVADLVGHGLLEDKAPIEDILVTGHSLGGAAATIFAAILSEILPPELAVKVRLITFEPARALRRSTILALMSSPVFASIAGNAIFIANGNDPVPQVPLGYGPEHGASGFQHVGVSWFIPREAVDGAWAQAHSSAAVVDSLKKTASLGIPKERLYVSNGSGIKRKTRAGSESMKKRMAYVRSFKKH